MANDACQPENPCAVGATACASPISAATCEEVGHKPDGTTCGTDQLCSSGTCVINRISVSISPATVSLLTNASQQFTATVTGWHDTGVAWSASAGSINSSGLFTAPKTPGTVTVTATSTADPTRSASATVTVSQVSIAISPVSAFVVPHGSQQFTATVTGWPDTSVTWTASAGSITSTGLFTAPGTPGSLTVVATSNADPTRTATAQVTVVSPWVGVKQLGTANDEGTSGIAVDAQGNAYVFGTTSGAFAGNDNAGGSDVFVAKLDRSGNLLWVKQLGSEGGDWASGGAVDAQGNAYISGSTDGAFGGNHNAGGADAFVAKLDAAGDIVWVKQFGTPEYDSADGVALDAQGNAHLSGITDGELAFVAMLDSAGDIVRATHLDGSAIADWDGFSRCPGLAIDSQGNTYVSGNFSTRWYAWVAFVAKVDRSYATSWLVEWPHAYNSSAADSAVDADGNSYVVGYEEGRGGGPTPGYGPVVTKIDTDGNTLWQRGGLVTYSWMEGVALDALGNAYVVGPAYEDPLHETTTAFIGKLDSSGNKVWTRTLETPAAGSGCAVVMDPQGNAYVSGSTDGSCTSAGLRDVFIAKFDPLGIIQ